MEFRVLGPVKVRRDGRELPLGGPKQRALLAILLLNANEVVSRDRLIDGLWGERPPPTAAHTLDNYVSRLRKILGGDRISRHPPGYVLHLAADELDLDRFEQCLHRGRDQVARGDSAEAAAILRSALALWRGPALADVLYEPFAATEAERLEQRRLVALEERIEADLASSRSRELIPELEALVAEHPFRERLLGQLVLALYRAGRQTEALANLRTARRQLAEELGLEPGPQLRGLERQILAHDPALAAPRLDAEGQRRRRMRPIVLAVAGAAAAASVAVGIVLGLGQTTASTGEAAGANQLVEVDARSARVVGASALRGVPNALAGGRESIWAADPDSAVVSRFSVSSRAVVDRIPVPGQPAEVAVGNGSVWVTNTLGGAVVRIDPGTERITQTIPLAGSLAAIAAGTRALWVADAGDQTLIRLDPETGTATQTVSLPTAPSALAVGYGTVWVASHDGGTVTQVDAHANRALATVSVGQGPAAVAVGGGSVWVANNLDGTVSRIDPETTRVSATISVGSGPVALAFGSGSLWVANKFSNSVSRIDPGINAVVHTVRTRGRPISIAAVGERVWVGTRPTGDTHRGGTLTLLGFRPSIDSAFNQQNYPPPQFLGLTQDTLVTFEHAPGPDGLQLVPDLALALPAPTRAGRMYAFRLRPGIHYSDDRPLRASDFRRAIERLFRVGSPGAGNFTSIVGGTHCARAPHRCDLSGGIIATDATRTVTFRLAFPDSEFLHKLALGYAAPVPSGTPNREVGANPIPGTGPYRIVRSTPSETRFVRNPRFQEWSHAAQPAGYPDAIVWRYNLSAATQARAVQQGRADWMFEQIPAKLRSAITIHQPAQLRVSPVFGTEFLQINTRLGPFDHLAARRALNYAIDRAELVRLYGGRSLAIPTCQVLPPGLPGHRRYCPYTLHPSRDGRWTSPNMARARELVAASGTRGDRVTVSAFNDDSAFHKRVARYIAGVLRKLGYRVRTQTTISRSRDGVTESVQLLPNTWFGGELGAGDFLQNSFACNGPESRGWFCDPQLDRLMRRASALEASDPQRAAAAWAAIDRKVVDAAGWVPLVTPREVEFISSRVRNYQYHPLWGALVDQFWLR